MNIFTIGFTQKTAQQFFDLLKKHHVECVVDIRLHPDGQLAGFTKKEDLRYFLRNLLDCDYHHIEYLAPTKEILKTYHQNKDWDQYEKAFHELMTVRNIPAILDRNLFEKQTCCLLCSEPKADKCHRRLVAEILAHAWENVNIFHIQ